MIDAYFGFTHRQGLAQLARLTKLRDLRLEQCPSIRSCVVALTGQSLDAHLNISKSECFLKKMREHTNDES